jgi:hypothetical protein
VCREDSIFGHTPSNCLGKFMDPQCSIRLGIQRPDTRRMATPMQGQGLTVAIRWAMCHRISTSDPNMLDLRRLNFRLT